MPYQVNRASLIDNIVDLVKTKKITEISDLRNESDRSGMRLVIELKREAIPMVVLNKLYKHTQMQTTFGIINIALVGGVPRTLTLPEMIQAYIAFQKEIVIRRTKFELDKAETRAHILEGLLVALDNLDQIISIIRHAADGETAREALMDTFELTRPQAQAILDLRLQKLTGLERDKVKEEHAGLLARIERVARAARRREAPSLASSRRSLARSGASSTTTGAPRSCRTRARSTSKTSSPRSRWRSRSPRPAT